MNVPLAPESPTFPRPPLFTLESALRWLGHDCPGYRCCCAPIESMQASVWFIRHGLPFPTFPFQTRVLVDPSETGGALAHLSLMIDQVNWCTRHDAIEVRLRAPASLVDNPRPTWRHDAPEPSADDLRDMAMTRW